MPRLPPPPISSGKTMEGVGGLDKFDADLDDDMNEEEDGDPAAAVEPPTRKQRQRDLPCKHSDQLQPANFHMSQKSDEEVKNT